jgi:hypothetical protein
MEDDKIWGVETRKGEKKCVFIQERGQIQSVENCIQIKYLEIGIEGLYKGVLINYKLILGCFETNNGYYIKKRRSRGGKQ